MLIMSFGCLRFSREPCSLYAFLLGYLPSIFLRFFLQNLLTFICRTLFLTLSLFYAISPHNATPPRRGTVLCEFATIQAIYMRFYARILPRRAAFLRKSNSTALCCAAICYFTQQSSWITANFAHFLHCFAATIEKNKYHGKLEVRQLGVECP